MSISGALTQTRARREADTPRRERLNTERIVEVAGDIADLEGLAALNAGRLAHRLRIKAPSLYRHFPNIDVIKDALAARALAEMIALLKDATRGRQGRDALAALAHGHRTFAQAKPGRYMAAAQGERGRSPAVASLHATLLRLAANVLETYHLDGDDALEVARSLVAAVQGFAVLELSGGIGTPYETDQSYQRLLEMLDAGARAAARASLNRRRGRPAPRGPSTFEARLEVRPEPAGQL